MKTKLSLFSAFFTLLALSFSSCIKDSCERTLTYIKVEPVYVSYDEIRNGTVESEEPRELKKPGKIYFYNNYIFINESREGVHVIDNTNPESPQNIAFISIPGNEDISIKNGLLYANSYKDLLTVNISNVHNAQLESRTESMFPVIWDDPENERILAYYSEEEVTEKMSCAEMNNLQRSGDIFWGCAFCDFAVAESFLSNVPSGSAGTAGGGGTGTGGSMARFSIIGDYLYTIDNMTLNVFSLSNPNTPDLANSVDVGWGIETIFPHEDKLFIGSNTGMFIFDNSNPEAPSMLSAFQHARACDPVFVKDNFAYVTLRDGTRCEGFVNQLDLIDITDLTNPVLVKTFPMDNPHGLSIRDNSLFLCEGDFGLKVFDIEIPTDLDRRKIDHKTDLHAYDAIAVPGQENVLLVIGQDGFYQYDFDNPSNLRLMSQILVRE